MYSVKQKQVFILSLLRDIAAWSLMTPATGRHRPVMADGVAAALEAGYSLEVGQRGHEINFGLKYEADIAGANHTISSLGFRVSYQFNLFRKKDDY